MPDGVRALGSDSKLHPDPDALVCELPASSEREAAELLEVIGSGGALGTGYGMYRFGVNLPEIRGAYEAEVEQLIHEIERRKKFMKPRALADWAVNERAGIARRIRAKYQGLGATVVYEVRDTLVYGPGGRTPRNLRRRAARKHGLGGQALNRKLMTSATTPNPQISGAVKGARYLRHGGRVVIVLSLATSAYVLLTAEPEELEKLLYEEVGGAAGGTVGAGAGVGLCLLLGVASGGWGLLACGIVGGVAGGAGGAMAGEKLYYTTHDGVVTQAESTGVVDPSLLSDTPDPGLVCR